jgi:hypothetical protein
MLSMGTLFFKGDDLFPKKMSKAIDNIVLRVDLV